MYSDIDGFQVVSGKAPVIEERWPPLGAAASASPVANAINERLPMSRESSIDKLRNMEEEQEHLNRSLLALTTHFAQVQFRLRQIVEAEQEEKEVLLRELERFAFQGVPELKGSDPTAIVEEMSHREYEQKLDRQKDNQQKLITHLKLQLEDLERYAAQESARSTVTRPDYDLHDKQRVIIDELRNRLGIKVDSFDSLKADDLKTKIDYAVKQLVRPVKTKEQLVKQLTTQVIDLERYIAYLQGESSSPGPYGKHTQSNFPTKRSSSVQSRNSAYNFDDTLYDDMNDDLNYYEDSVSSAEERRRFKSIADDGREPETTFVRRMLKILDIFTGGADDIRVTSKGAITNKIDTRFTLSKLDEAVDRIIAVKCENVERGELRKSLDLITANSPNDLFKIITKQFANSLMLLLQHGLSESTESGLLPPMTCLSFIMKANREEIANPMHSWQLFVRYYNSRQGNNYNAIPIRRLSHSFGNDVVGLKAVSAKQILLSTMYDILSAPEARYKTDDFKFRALIFAGLNSQKLSHWFKLISSSNRLLETHYLNWAYVINGGFRQIIDIIDKLSPLKFDIPVALTVHEKNDIFYS